MIVDIDERPRDGFDCPDCLYGHEEGELICPECHESAHVRPPSAWVPAWGPPPPHSHRDGLPLCPVMTATGYRPADPITYQRNDQQETP
ncbi:hypothetical protein ACQEVB_32775 [Pseudonocardia sp. CA-107938]|uniref:hypothetical protein n=1 Tax=Pseudonocardia sp. CA-107938 TaxID=3240021 RepID=UPI003D8F6879